MPKTKTTRDIAAPPERVFETVAHIETYEKVQPAIQKIEFLTDQKTGVGTRFRETRTMNGKPVTVELEVTEYDPPRHVRIVSDENGTIWDTVFTIEPNGEGSRLTMVMDARAYKLIPRLLNPLIMGMVAKNVGIDMDHVKAACEEGEDGEEDR